MDLVRCVMQNPTWVLDSEAWKAYIDSTVGLGRPGHLQGTTGTQTCTVYQAVWLTEEAHLCAVLMPTKDDCGPSETSILFVEFRELNFCVVSIYMVLAEQEI